MQKAVVLSVLVVGILLVRAVIADAQQPTKIYKVGWLGARSPSAPTREVFRREIRALGYDEGKNIAFEHRYAEGKLDRLPALVTPVLILLRLGWLVQLAVPATTGRHAHLLLGQQGWRARRVRLAGVLSIRHLRTG
jgi:hypothetical protein